MSRQHYFRMRDGLYRALCLPNDAEGNGVMYENQVEDKAVMCCVCDLTKSGLISSGQSREDEIIAGITRQDFEWYAHRRKVEAEHIRIRENERQFREKLARREAERQNREEEARRRRERELEENKKHYDFSDIGAAIIGKRIGWDTDESIVDYACTLTIEQKELCLLAFMADQRLEATRCLLRIAASSRATEAASKRTAKALEALLKLVQRTKQEQEDGEE